MYRAAARNQGAFAAFLAANGSYVAGEHSVPSSARAFATGLIAAVVVANAAGETNASAESQGADAGTKQPSWFERIRRGCSTSSSHVEPPAAAAAHTSSSSLPASAAVAWQQQQQWGNSGNSSTIEPLSGAIPALSEDGLTNHPLDYNAITNEHTAAMTLAKQAGVEAYQAGRYNDAERWFKEALEEAKLGFPPGDPHIPAAMHCMAELYRNTRRYSEAEQLYKEAIDLLHDHLGEKHWMYAGALCSLASLYEAQGKQQQAVSILETALELRRQLFSDASFVYADTASLLAGVLLKQCNASQDSSSNSSDQDSAGNSSSRRWFRRKQRAQEGGAGTAGLERAIQLYSTAIKIVEDAGSIEGTPVVSWLLDLATAQQAAGRPADAVVSLHKALEYMAVPQATATPTAAPGSSTSSSKASDLRQGMQPLPSATPPAAVNEASDVPEASTNIIENSSNGSSDAVPAAELIRQKLAAQVHTCNLGHELVIISIGTKLRW
eukprot:GHRR01020762.1.p1 GENE.GHRR01020762.1~~GHRR01020762.1.p1  ORF type:complete len:495 (+),score=208.15 GHRR01020762.1:103-1587(+)